MDECSGKRAGDGFIVSRKGPALVLRDTGSNKDRNAQFGNRIGCSGRLNSTKAAQTSYLGKAKASRPPPLRFSTSGKEIIGSSSGTCSSINNPRKCLTESRKKLSSQVEFDSSETSSVQDKPEVQEHIVPPGNIQRSLHLESDDASSSEINSMEVGSTSVPTSTRSRRNFHPKSGLGNPDNLVGSPASLVSKSTNQVTRANPNKYGLRNLKCNSVSDIVPSGSSGESNLSRRKDVAKRRIFDGESSSSARGKKVSGSPVEGQNYRSRSGISISDSRRARGGPANKDNSAASVRTRRSLSGYSRVSVGNQGSGISSSPIGSHVVISQSAQQDMPVDLNGPSSSYQFSIENSLTRPSSYSRPGSSHGSLRGIRPSSPAEIGGARSLMNRESFWRYNIDGIAEVLLALERIEQEEELTYEQLLVLETNLFLNGLNFHDQHRDMRLDIDNMSYEELLALEERMGTVSTALSEEALLECLKTSIYQSASEDPTTKLEGDDDDIKCSICQEEYADGDEVGRVPCEHRYHVACIQQWLRLKNWCPICKASVAPSPPSSPSSPLPPSS